MGEQGDVVVFILISGAPDWTGTRPRLRDGQTHVAGQVQGRSRIYPNLYRRSPTRHATDYIGIGSRDTIRHRLATDGSPADADTYRETRYGRGDMGDRPGH